jgi:ceramide glucosyltransferase
MTREFVALFFLGLSAAGCIYVVVAAALTVRYGRRQAPLPERACPVTVLKPLCGDEPHLYERLQSFCTQDYLAPVQVILGIQSPDDSALGAATRLAAAFPEQVEVSVGSNSSGTNRKVCNLVGMAKLARHDVFVLSDSDIEVEPDYLQRVVGKLQDDPEIGVVTCLYHGIPRQGLWSQICAMAVNSSFLPSVLVGLRLGLARPCFGSTIVIRRETLSAIGGFGAYADQLADDYAIGFAVRRLGLKVALPAFTVGHVCRERSIADLWRHELRWARTVRAIDPVGYAGTLIAHPLAWALLAAIFDNKAGFLLAGAALACRYALCVAVERRFRLPRHSPWLIPLRDMFSFAIFVASFAGRAVQWRDRRYYVTSSGSLRTSEATR